MLEDPIVAEVHRAREKLAAQYNFDLGAFFADVRRRQVALGDRLVPQKMHTEPRAEANHGRPSGSPESIPSEDAPTLREAPAK